MKQFAKKVRVPLNSRAKTYHDTKEIVQNGNVLNFFPANASRKVERDNYVSNPLPGQDERLVVGLSFDLIMQYIHDDIANGIDVEAIVNGIKDAGVTFTADNNHKEFLRAPMSEYFNFAGTSLNIRLGATSSGGTAPELVETEEKTGVIKSAPMFRVPNPFIIAPTQSFDLRVEFADASVFPANADWVASGQGPLLLQANLYVAEIEPKKAHA